MIFYYFFLNNRVMIRKGSLIVCQGTLMCRTKMYDFFFFSSFFPPQNSLLMIGKKAAKQHCSCLKCYSFWAAFGGTQLLLFSIQIKYLIVFATNSSIQHSQLGNKQRLLGGQSKVKSRFPVNYFEFE